MQERDALGDDLVPDYFTHVPALVRRHGGEYLAVPKGEPGAVELLEGDAPVPQTIVLISFPSIEASKAFLADPEYAPFKAARVRASDSTIFGFENDPTAPQFAGG